MSSFQLIKRPPGMKAIRGMMEKKVPDDDNDDDEDDDDDFNHSAFMTPNMSCL